MRLVAMFVAGLLLMQLPATASIVSSASLELESPAMWNVSYGYLAWDASRGVFRLSAGEAAADFETVELFLASDVFPCRAISDFELSSLNEAGIAKNIFDNDVALLANFRSPGTLSLEMSAIDEAEAYSKNTHIAATSVCPEPATLTIWGISALALAAATYRRQKRAGRNKERVQAAVEEYLAACTSPSDHFRMLGSYLTKLADDPNWTKQDVEAFYDEVVVVLHRRREHAEVA